MTERIDQNQIQKPAASISTTHANNGVNSPTGRRWRRSMASANLVAISTTIRPNRIPNRPDKKLKSSICSGRVTQTADGGKAGQGEADDPARNHCGCFLPDLTRLATAPSADFRAG